MATIWNHPLFHKETHHLCNRQKSSDLSLWAIKLRRSGTDDEAKPNSGQQFRRRGPSTPTNYAGQNSELARQTFPSIHRFFRFLFGIRPQPSPVAMFGQQISRAFKTQNEEQVEDKAAYVPCRKHTSFKKKSKTCSVDHDVKL